MAKFQFRNKLVQQKGDFYGAIRPPASNGLSINNIKSRRVKLIELLNNKLDGLSPFGGLVSPPGGFASLSFDQGVP